MEANTYEKFDPEWYVSHYFATEAACDNISIDQDGLFDAIKACNLKGGRLLDVGTGPVVHTVLSASQFVTEIYLSDYAPQNRRYLQQWLAGEKSSPRKILEYAIRLDGAQQTPEDREKQVRQQVKGILPIDVMQTSPLGSWKDCTEFDAIISSCCLESATTTVDGFFSAVRNIANLLKAGGNLVLLGGLGGSHYKVGEVDFSTLNISNEEVKQSLADAGLDIIFYHEILATEEDKTLYNIAGYYYIAAVKR